MKAADAPANNAEHDGGFFCDLMKKCFGMGTLICYAHLLSEGMN